MKPVEENLARFLIRESERYSKAQALERFAISYNTLRKIEAGLPLRPSVAERLEDRLRAELTRHRHIELDAHRS